MIIKHFPVFLILFLAISCRSSSNLFMSGAPVVVSTYPKESIDLTPVDSLQGEFMNNVIGLHCIVDSVAILQLSDSDYEFRALNLSSKKCVDFLPVGRGSGEVVFGYFSQCRKVDSVNIIDIVDISKHQMFSIDLDKTINQSRTVILKVMDIPNTVGPSYIIGDKRLDEVAFDSKGYTLKLVDENGVVIKEDYVFSEGKIIPRYQPLFNSSKRISPDGTKFTMAMSRFDKINVYDITGTNHFSISTKENVDDKSILSDVMKTDSFGNHYYYFDIHDVSANHIYALYFDCDWVSSEFQHTPTIQVFDWSGTFSKAINVTEPLHSIVISKDESILYGLVAHSSIYLYAL